MKIQEDWFVDWFDSPFYHVLYENRDFEEAEQFIGNLFKYLKLTSSVKILDLACGKGRHARQVHGLGFNVLGADLSSKSIEYAKKYSTKGLDFVVADMRDIGIISEFEIVLNLFTSFGYFQKEGDNVRVIESISKSLKKNGVLILDYLNVEKVVKELPTQENIQKGDVTFNLQKKVEENFIVKNISFEKDGRHSYKEYVKLIDLDMFKCYFNSVGLEVIETFGDYSLHNFDRKNSDRLILIAKKR